MSLIAAVVAKALEGTPQNVCVRREISARRQRDGRDRSLNIQQIDARTLRCSCRQLVLDARSQISRPETQRLEMLIHARPGVMRRPPRRVLEPPNRPNAPLLAQREPVRRSLGHPQHVSRHNLDGNHPVALAKKKTPRPARIKRTSSSECVCSLSKRASIASRFGVSACTSITSAVT